MTKPSIPTPTPLSTAPANVPPATQSALRTTQSKRALVAAMLLRDEGATLDQIIVATGWLPHTTRAALSGLRKAGYAIDSDKMDGKRTYRAVAPQ